MPSTTGPAHPPSPSPGDRPGRLGRGTVASLLAVATLTALCYPLLSVGLTYAPPFQFAVLRAGTAGLALLMLALMLRRPFPQTRGLWLRVALSGLSATTIGFAAMFGAAGLVAPGIATVVAGTQPIVAALLALAMFGQPFKARQAAGMSIALAGIATMTLQDIWAGGSASAWRSSSRASGFSDRIMVVADPEPQLFCAGGSPWHRWHGGHIHTVDRSSEGLSAERRERLQLPRPADRCCDQCRVRGREPRAINNSRNGPDAHRDRACPLTQKIGVSVGVLECDHHGAFSCSTHPMQTVQTARQKDWNHHRPGNDKNQRALPPLPQPRAQKGG